METALISLSSSDALEQKIKNKIHDFELRSLIRLLVHMGYRLDDIYFVSNHRYSSESSFCTDILFHQNPYTNKKFVQIELSTGLLKGNSPLPYFFKKKMDQNDIHSEPFKKFIQFFDHLILKNYILLNSLMIFKESGLNWKEMLEQYLSMMQVATTSSLSHLFQLCFPELHIEVKKSFKLMGRVHSSIRLGSAILDQRLMLGNKVQASEISFIVLLYANQARTDMAIPWAKEAKKRLKEVLYHVLKKVDIHLQIIMTIRHPEDQSNLSDDGCLGYGRLGKSTNDLKLFLFYGEPKQIPSMRI